jgi:hypothetical protein
MSDARKTFQVAFWETEDTTNRSSLLREYDDELEARAEIARELSHANYKVAGLYKWAGAEWSEVRMFTAHDFPDTSTMH